MGELVFGPDCRRRILYMMHVDWYWIKQRPQFLAEELAKYHDVHVLYRARPRLLLENLPSRPTPPTSALAPVPWDCKPLARISRWLQQNRISRVAGRFRPDTIWVTHPSLSLWIPGYLCGLPLVYDCMDDALAFRARSARLRLLASLERDLVRRAALVLCSSDTLRERVISRYGPEYHTKIWVVRNAVSQAFLGVAQERGSGNARAAGPIRFAYIGTIGNWLDLAALLSALDSVPNAEFHLAGPLVGIRLPTHDRLKYRGVIPHPELLKFAAEFDAFLLPFRLNPLTKAVDPVKLYEYLAFGKEIICIRYREVERFGDFVHFYSSCQEFVDLVARMADGRLQSKSRGPAASSFLVENTWQARCAVICQLLGALERPTRQ